MCNIEQRERELNMTSGVLNRGQCGETCDDDPSCIGALWTRAYATLPDNGDCYILYQGGNKIIIIFLLTSFSARRRGGRKEEAGVDELFF